VNGEMVSGKPHTRLEAWKIAMDLVEETYRITEHFPAQEKFGLTSQMRRAAVSIPSNLAEGAARDSQKEFARFLSIARGSLSELDTQREIAIRIGFLKHQNNSKMSELLERTSKLITGLHKKIKSTLTQ